MDLESAQLILNTINSTGNTDRTSFTWNNINLRNALGDMYEKYDLFTLYLNVIASDTVTTGYNLTDGDRQGLVRVSGLPFLNITYNSNKMSSVIIGNYVYPVSNISQKVFGENSYATFGKNQELLNINIDMLRISDLTLCKPAASRTFPELVFWFSIVGIQKDKGNLNGTRIEIN